MITTEQLEDLVATTMKDMPLLPIDQYLSAPCENEVEAKLMMDFVRNHFSPEEIAVGTKKLLDEQMSLIKLWSAK